MQSLTQSLKQTTLTGHNWVAQTTEVYSHSSGGCTSKIEVPADSFPGVVSLPGLQTDMFLLCAYMAEREVGS